MYAVDVTGIAVVNVGHRIRKFPAYNLAAIIVTGITAIRNTVLHVPTIEKMGKGSRKREKT